MGTARPWPPTATHQGFRAGGRHLRPHRPEDEVFLPRRVPHSHRITSESADLLLFSTPGGPEKMFRHACRDLRAPRPDGFEIPLSLLAEAAEISGNVVLGPPR